MNPHRYLLWSLLALPLLELGLMIRLGLMFGVLPVILWIVAAGLVGLGILRTRSWVILSRVQQAIRSGASPGSELLDQAVVVCGALLLIVPGFITDTLAAFCLIPRTRAAIAQRAKRWLISPQTGAGSTQHVFDGEFRREK